MNLLIEFIEISKTLKAKSKAGRNSTRLKTIREYVWKTRPARRIARKNSLYYFLPPLWFLSTRILQNNLLHLYLGKFV